MFRNTRIDYPPPSIVRTNPSPTLRLPNPQTGKAFNYALAGIGQPPRDENIRGKARVAPALLGCGVQIAAVGSIGERHRNDILADSNARARFLRRIYLP